MMAFDLKGRVAAVTGAGGGLGLGMARGLAEAGAQVAILGRDADKGSAAAEGLRALGGRSEFLPLDVASRQSCHDAIAQVGEHFGRCDILINNAGINIRKMPQDLTEEDWHAVIDVNLSGPLFMAQSVYPLMKKLGAGKIINIGSMYSLFGAPQAAAYAASKGGVAQLTRALAAAWAPDNIQVNAILPGWLDTDLTRQAREQVADLDRIVLQRTPAGRWGDPGDLAGAAIFLASAASDFVTGALLPVDGGYSSRG